MHDKEKNTLTGAQAHKLNRWIEDHGKEHDGKSWNEFTDAAQAVLGFPVTIPNVRTACDAVGHVHTNSREAAKERRKPDFVTRIEYEALAEQVRTLEQQVLTLAAANEQLLKAINEQTVRIDDLRAVMA